MEPKKITCKIKIIDKKATLKMNELQQNESMSRLII